MKAGSTYKYFISAAAGGTSMSKPVKSSREFGIMSPYFLKFRLPVVHHFCQLFGHVGVFVGAIVRFGGVVFEVEKPRAVL